MDTATGYVGLLGIQQNPAVDYVESTADSPSGQSGDRSIRTYGAGFLLADDSSSKVLAITNGPITLEAWAIFRSTVSTEGVIAYGSSYKMGTKGFKQVFTLFGKIDITNEVAGFLPADVWTHLAAAWTPGVGVDFYVNGAHSFVEYTNSATARAPLNNYLSISSEGFGNSMLGSLDRVRVHNAVLSESEIDSVAATPKPAYASTLVNYQFNETSLPATSSLSPSLPTIPSYQLLPMVSSPLWTNDTPSGLPGDFALSFDRNLPFKEVVSVDFGGTPLDLASNNTNYTLQAWIKLPTRPIEERQVIFRTDGPAPRVALSISVNHTLHTTVLGTADFTTSVGIPNDNRWHHIAVVMQDFARLHFYLDGAFRQTVNRTQTGAASSSATPGMLIGKESEARYFRGILDRVVINNNALTNSTLDFPAIPGLATFPTAAAQPADATVAAGTTAQFTAAPSSPSSATYQWYYRTKLADVNGVAIPGATGTSLSVTNASSASEGFYSLVVSNAVGVVESHRARLTLRSSLALSFIGFEQPKYVSGPIEEQDYWINDLNGSNARVLASAEIAAFLDATGRNPALPVHEGSQALVVSGPGLSTATIRPIVGLESETNITLDVWMRPLSAGNVGNALGNTFVTLENASSVRAAGVRFGPGFSIDYGLVGGAWVATGIIADPDTWYRITFKLNYATKTYDFFVNNNKINSSAIPFYTSTSDKPQQVRIFRGTGQAGLIMDELSVVGPAAAPQLGIRKSGDSLVLFWPSTATDFLLESADSLTNPSWGPVPYTVVGNENQATVQPTGVSKFFRLRK